jgi:hypothetical protein
MFLETKSDLDQYVVVGNEFLLASLLPIKNDALRKYFEKYFPKALISEIEGYKGDSDLEIKQQAFLLFENALAKLSMYEYLVHGQILISEGNISRLENENSKTAYKNQISEARELYFDTAMDIFESIINHLDAHSNGAVFSTWPTSVLKLQLKRLLIKSASKFNEIERLHRENSTFFALISCQTTMIDLRLKAKFPATLIDELITGGVLSAEKTIFNDYIQKALANLTVAQAIEKNLAVLTSDGIRVIEKDKDTSSYLEKTPESSSISSMMRTYNDIGKRYMDLANEYMYANPTAFGITGEKTTLTKTAIWM